MNRVFTAAFAPKMYLTPFGSFVLAVIPALRDMMGTPNRNSSG